MQIAKTKKYGLTKFSCYAAYFTMSSVFCVPPLLFVTFNEMYEISFTLLGTLVLVNFCTQLGIDFIFTFLSKYFNIKLTVRMMPLITALGLMIYALVPRFFPQYAYAGLLVGTMIFSVSAGLSEVLTSPVIAAIPSDDPQKDMSFLHSVYGIGVVSMVSISSLFFKIFGTENWVYLVMFLAFLPVIASVLFMLSPMPHMGGSEAKTEKGGTKNKAIGLALCFACIFFGSCAENTMASWVSGFIETSISIDKALGDIIGAAAFAALLAAARILYAKYGKNIMLTLLVGMIGAAVCYLTVGFSSSPVLSVIACMLTGLFTSMLWPGTLIMMEENIKGAGVAAFALMAAGGDTGAAVSPQLLGVITDTVAESALGARLAQLLGVTALQAGMRVGMLVCALFPIMGIFVVLFIMRYFKKAKE